MAKRAGRAKVAEQVRSGLKILSEDQVRRIHAASLQVLQRTGVLIESEEALAMLRKAGCRVKNGVAKFPPGLVEWAVDAAPSQFLLYDRTGGYALTVGGCNTYFGLGPTLLYMIDPETGEQRRFVKSGTERTARLADALPNIEWLMGLGTISDCDPQYADRHEFDALVRNTTKPLVIWAESAQGVRDIVRIAQVVAGGEERFREAPFIAFFFAPTSPLAQDKRSIEKLLCAVDHGIPTVYAPAPQAGASAPVTLAGELVSVNAENLASVVVSQLRKAGFPIVVGGVLGTMDMLHAQLAYGAPEMQLMLAAYMDIARYYNLPSWGTAGCSDSKLLDQQAAIEAAQSVLYSALSGANLVHDVGYLGSGRVGSPEMVTMVDEIISMAKYIGRGIRIDEESLALDVIDQVGPGGEFLTSPHTLKHFRDQLWFPSLMDRNPYDKWFESGAKTMRQRVKEKARHILKTHEPEPLPEAILEEIDDLLPS